MNEIVNKFLLAGDKCMPEIHEMSENENLWTFMEIYAWNVGNLELHIVRLDCLEKIKQE